VLVRGLYLIGECSCFFGHLFSSHGFKSDRIR
jgi:hypothetical protein